MTSRSKSDLTRLRVTSKAQSHCTRQDVLSFLLFLQNILGHCPLRLYVAIFTKSAKPKFFFGRVGGLDCRDVLVLIVAMSRSRRQPPAQKKSLVFQVPTSWQVRLSQTWDDCLRHANKKHKATSQDNFQRPRVLPEGLV